MKKVIVPGKRSAFTLIELLIVMIIIASLALLLIGNFMSSLAKGRDSKRKADVNQLRQAVEMYYEDKRTYPLQNNATMIKSGTSYINKGKTFIENSKTYVGRLPEDPNSTYEYAYTTDASGSYFRFFTCIENKNDKGEGVSQKGFEGSQICGSCGVCKYTISSPNVTPLPTLP